MGEGELETESEADSTRSMEPHWRLDLTTKRPPPEPKPRLDAQLTVPPRHPSFFSDIAKFSIRSCKFVLNNDPVLVGVKTELPCVACDPYEILKDTF